MADELVLIAYDERPSYVIESLIRLGFGLAGADLNELALAGRVDALDGKVVVLEYASLGHARLDAALERIARASEPHSPDWWIGRLRSGMRKRLLGELTDRGMLRLEHERVLGVVPVRRYLPVDFVLKSTARTRLRRAVVEPQRPDVRTAALASVLHACGLGHRTFHDVEPRALNARMAELDHAQWVTEAIQKAILSVQVGIAGASTGGGVAGTGLESG